MEIKFRNIILRDMIESDIEDWIRWDSVDTEWMNWDAPDEPTEQIDAEEYRNDLLGFLSEPRGNQFRNFFELATSDGYHIGRINSYALSNEYESIPWQDDLLADMYVAIGIDICDNRFWNRGYGRSAIIAFVIHFLNHGIINLFLQTWSGNIRMIRCAEAIGFYECKRVYDNRFIRGEKFDSLTFCLDLDRFHKYLEENP